MRRADEFWMWWAWRVPRRLAYWCAVRVGCHATQGKWGHESPSELLMMDALKRWEQDDDILIPIAMEMERQRGW